MDNSKRTSAAGVAQSDPVLGQESPPLIVKEAPAPALKPRPLPRSLGLRTRRDNYTEPDFFSQLELNPGLKYYSLFEVILKSSRLALQLSSTFLFFVVYYNLKNQLMQPKQLSRDSWSSSVIGHFIYQIYNNQPFPTWGEGFALLFPKEHVKVTFVYVAYAHKLTPILRTLTESISTDTIYVCSGSLIFVHLLTNDYGVAGPFVSKTLSMNSAVISALCLSSRLSTDYHCLVLVTLAVQLFILFPIFSRILWDSGSCLLVVVSFVSYACTLVSINLCVTYVVIMVFVIFVVPILFTVSQKSKRNMYGPWDEAVVRIERD